MTDCIETWKPRDKKGYGRIWHLGLNTRHHRAVWIDHHGPIPEGMVVRHRCDNPPCINIDHLLLGTVADNNWDRSERGTWTNVGEKHGRAKLTEADVLAIRASTEPARALAAKYGVGKTAIKDVRSRTTWRHL